LRSELPARLVAQTLLIAGWCAKEPQRGSQITPKPSREVGTKPIHPIRTSREPEWWDLETWKPKR